MGIGMVVYMCCVCLYIFCITTHLTSRKDIEPYIGVVVIEESPNGINIVQFENYNLLSPGHSKCMFCLVKSAITCKVG